MYLIVKVKIEDPVQDDFAVGPEVAIVIGTVTVKGNSALINCCNAKHVELKDE